MRWRGRQQSQNVDDRRGQSGGRGRGGRVAMGGGIGAIIMALIAIFVFGQDPMQVLSQTMSQRQSPSSGPVQSIPRSAEEDEAAQFVSVVLRDTESVWSDIFAANGSRYTPPTLVLFTGSTDTACGYGSAATGPFYCPADQNVYIDLSFFAQLQRMGGRGDFAVAYVIAHEVGHHVQTITGTSRQVRAAQARASKAQQNALNVRMELQADCFAGVWASLADEKYGTLEPGDVEEAMSAAAAVGDDTIQRSAGRAVRPETWTHGSSEDRMKWFQRGFQSGSINQCDTFGS
ncbi:MAG: neutral zinc metallopeptidase [Pseudomonadota bacterium]